MYKDPAKNREYQTRWIKNRRLAWLRENGPCQACGSWDNLEVDHKDPSAKLLPPSRLWSLSSNNPTRIAELAKCQVLCHKCHLEKTLSEYFSALKEGTRRTSRKLSLDDVVSIREMYNSGVGVSVIASTFSIHRRYVYRIINNEVRI